MSLDLIIAGIVGILLLYMLLKILKLPIKILINGIVGMVYVFRNNFLYLQNMHKHNTD